MKGKKKGDEGGLGMRRGRRKKCWREIDIKMNGAGKEFDNDNKEG